jgi:transketolase
MRLNERFLTEVRLRLIEMHYRNRVGHLGGNLSAIDSMLLVHHELMMPEDRFVLSKGHSAGAYYVVLWSLGKLSDADLDTFHRDDTRLPGHPPSSGISEIEFATGSLGHGLSLAAGLALAAKLKHQKHRIFCLTSDGEWQEGSTFEALIFAAHHKLSNLTIMIDHNRLQGFGTTAEVASMCPLHERLSGFSVDLRRCNGHDLDELRQTLAPATSDRPVVAVLETRKGNGVPDFEGAMESHYLLLTEPQYTAAILALGRRA